VVTVSVARSCDSIVECLTVYDMCSTSLVSETTKLCWEEVRRRLQQLLLPISSFGNLGSSLG